jgi:hypothetical protein
VTSCAVLLAGCTGNGSASHAPTQTAGAQFSSAETAVKRDCQAYWVGEFIQDTHHTQIQWETKTQYGSGSGLVAKLGRSANGFRVINCHAGGYGHG